MSIAQTQPLFKNEHAISPTESLQRDDWWISTFDHSPLHADTDSSHHLKSESTVTGEEPGTSIKTVTKKVNAIQKESTRLSLHGDKKTLLQQWECVVLGTDVETVHCEMRDLSDENMPVEYAELFWGEFNEYDKPLLEEGAVFYWSIGQLRRESGQVLRFSEIWLRRMPKLGRAARQEIASKVKAFDGLRDKR